MHSKGRQLLGGASEIGGLGGRLPYPNQAQG